MTSVVNLRWRALRSYLPQAAQEAKQRAAAQAAAADAPDGAGQANFGVVRFRVSMLDWFRLQRNDNRRALFAYGPGGKIVTQLWVNP